MQAFARWTNLSETTYLLRPTKPEADYLLRIFTPDGKELPFAGHPTLGSAYAWIQHGGQPKADTHLIQECQVGLIRIRQDGNKLGFRAPELLRSGEVEQAELQQVLKALNIAPSKVLASNWVDNGAGFMGLVLPSAKDVLAVRPDFQALGKYFVGLIGPHENGQPADMEVRALVSIISNGEDPATGSLNAGLAKWLISTHQAPASYTVRQGTLLDRQADIAISSESDGTIWVSGECTEVISGSVQI
ncbi:hypothetical protein MYAM1_002771 [Malassezia yamatoensis]|uniref:PhzF family phenazine biosynthesis protein n=1 Tax=Malassezia yamatoensis TaxID=253288 RepID=A0AAJ5YT91_9BASI|nr:hypothetical protein MYAM1_002771 [Malassezia yamatoensis]